MILRRFSNSITWILFFITSLDLVLAKTTHHAEDKTVTLNLLRTQPILQSHKATLAKRQAVVETAPLQNFYGREYTVEIGVGTPPQHFNVTIDTGSTFFWVASTECPSEECPGSRFNPKASSTYQSQFGSFRLTYAIGDARGNPATDTVTIGNSLSVPNQVFGAVTGTSNFLTNAFDNPSSGILGLGFPALQSATSGISGDPFVTNLIKNNLISAPIFSVYMNSQYQYGSLGGAAITFGGIDQTKYTGELKYTAVQPYTIIMAGINNEYLYWSVKGASIGATFTGGQPYTHAMTNEDVVFDTGSTISYAPPDVVRGLVEGITGKPGNFSEENQLYFVDCNIRNNGGQLTLQLADNIDLTVSINELIFPLETLDPRDASSCVFAFAPMQTSSTGSSLDYITYLLGQSVMRSFYTVHDMGNHRMGFAPAVLSAMTDDSLGHARPTPSQDSNWRPMNPAGTPGSGNENAASSAPAAFGSYFKQVSLNYHFAMLILVAILAVHL
ncbi:aspartic peptidase domain-containing protein [Phascolomyces articulosus]|uniref:Aspartic peptidase domain-containing protein n=1 Tax=Phascolomyces articulosus TaxID=60185 RepID=A0AAD5JP56_9FUNG|nr:aspartic peptidase domain-containing protein [Phascolomyces articulosus]